MKRHPSAPLLLLLAVWLTLQPAAAAGGRLLRQATELDTAAQPPAPEMFSNAFLTSAISFGEVGGAPCLTFSPEEGGWVENSTAVAYGASGNVSTPVDGQAQELAAQICADPLTAGERMVTGVAAGGDEALRWVYALIYGDCPAEDAPTAAYQVAIDTVNSGDPSDLEKAAAWLSNLVGAADAIGFPLCASLAVVDADSGQVLEALDFPTGAE